jgi:2-isopropylmalate synthase
VYSGVPAAMVGRSQKIEIGPMSGKSNVRCYLDDLGVTYDEALLEALLEHAKREDTILSQSAVRNILSSCEAARLRKRVG